jgi:hypothetical protein
MRTVLAEISAEQSEELFMKPKASPGLWSVNINKMNGAGVSWPSKDHTLVVVNNYYFIPDIILLIFH